MPVTVQLAMQLQTLRHLTRAEIAGKLHRSEEEIAEACRLLLLPLPDVEPARSARSDEERAALRERIPKNCFNTSLLGSRNRRSRIASRRHRD